MSVILSFLHKLIKVPNMVKAGHKHDLLLVLTRARTPNVQPTNPHESKVEWTAQQSLNYNAGGSRGSPSTYGYNHPEHLPLFVTQCLFHAYSGSDNAKLRPEVAIILQFCFWRCDIMEYSSICKNTKDTSISKTIIHISTIFD